MAKRTWTPEEIDKFKRRAYHRKRKRKKDQRDAARLGLTQATQAQLATSANRQIASVAVPGIKRGVGGGRRSRAGATRGSSSLSSGTKPHDIWHPEDHLPSEGRTVSDDPRDGLVLCQTCGKPVTMAEVGDGRWQARDEDGLPHKLTCQKDK